MGDSKALQKTHILVSTPGFIRNCLDGGAGRGQAQQLINPKDLKMVVFDEADDIFNNPETQKHLNRII